MGEIWHVIWWTHLTCPPYDVQGDWPELIDHYRTVSADAVGEFSHILPNYYVPRITQPVFLSPEERLFLPNELEELTKINGDRIAEGHTVLAYVFLATKVHLLLPCSRADLSQVVGRLKSRLATLLLFRPEREKSNRKLWGNGFWHVPLIKDESVDKTMKFIAHLHGG